MINLLASAVEIDALITVAGAIGVTLTGAIGVLWKIVMNRANECEAEHKITRAALLENVKEVGELKGQIGIAKEVSPQLKNIEKLTKEVLEEVTQKNKK